MDEILDGLPQKAKEKHSENKKFFNKLKQRPPKDLDYRMQEIHELSRIHYDRCPPPDA